MLLKPAFESRTPKMVAVFELAARIYLAYMLVEYGTSKLMGGMFANATPQILNTPLKDVDLFHLTWYWFYKNKLLTYFVGVIQIAAASLLLFNRTVLIGVAVAFPVLFSILLVDIYCAGSPALAIRVAFYICLLLGFVAYRWTVSKEILSKFLVPGNQPRGTFLSRVMGIAGGVLLIFLIELLLIRGLPFLFGQ